MPYTADSCFKYIALNFDDNLNSLVIWRDRTEAEKLSAARIKVLKKGVSKYMSSRKIEINSMGKAQKISRRSIEMTTDSTKIKYLLSLNSAFDVSKTALLGGAKRSHILRPRLFCGSCWANGFHLNKTGRELRKMERRKRRNTRAGGHEKSRRRLVWTGWKTGFHWSNKGKH